MHPRLEFPHTQPPASGVLMDIGPGVRWFRLPLPYRLDHVNIYLIDSGDGWTVLDTGLGTDACRTTWEAILNGPLDGQRLTAMIVTHFHPDHVGLAGWLSTPKLAMLIFLALPVFYGITSEGLTETRLRLQFGRAHRHAIAKGDHEGLRVE